jgi:hypothetical protein
MKVMRQCKDRIRLVDAVTVEWLPTGCSLVVVVVQGGRNGARLQIPEDRHRTAKRQS